MSYPYERLSQMDADEVYQRAVKKGFPPPLAPDFAVLKDRWLADPENRDFTLPEPLNLLNGRVWQIQCADRRSPLTQLLRYAAAPIPIRRR